MSRDGNGNDSGTKWNHLIHDPSSIYYLHPSENPRSPLSKYLLTGDNYYTWIKSITKALEGRNKLGFITGEFAPPEDATSPEFSAWKSNNSIICSQLFNSVDASIQPSIASHTIAKALWDNLADQYSINYEHHIHEMKSEYTLLRQGELSVDAYYNKFKSLWYELYGSGDATCGCICSAAPRIRAWVERDKTHHFLMGLDDDQFGTIRTQILCMDPLPTLNRAFYIVMSKTMNLEDDNSTESVDRENFPIEEVFEQLKCTREGLTSKEAAYRLELFGPNKLDEKKENIFLKLVCFMWYNLLICVTPIMAIALIASSGGKARDWQDFVVLIACLVVIIYSTISFIRGNRANNVGPKCKVLRDKQWKESEPGVLVPGDIINIKSGDVVPADARLLEGGPIVVDQSILTGDCLPLTFGPGNGVYSGSTCKRGDIEAVVIATGVNTFFGARAHHLVDSRNNVSRFHQVVTDIFNFCIISIAVVFVHVRSN